MIADSRLYKKYRIHT